MIHNGIIKPVELIANEETVNTAHPLPVTVVGGGASDGAIVDGVTGTIKATVFDYANSNPLAVVLRDPSGDYVAVGGGTQYTEDAVAPADPTGTALVMTRDDQLSAVTEAEGDWSRARGTSKGALWVAIPDAAGDPITSFGGGTQYTEGDVDASITGNALMLEGAANTLVAAPGTAADGLLVNLGANNDITVASLPLPTGASTSALQTQPGVDIGDVTINNGTGASAVNIRDGGNSITVDATSWPLPTLAATSTQQSDGTQKTQIVDSGFSSIDSVFGVSGRALQVSDYDALTSLLDIEISTTSLSVNQLNGAQKTQITNSGGTAVSLGGGTEATALRVTVATDSTGVLSVDDNGASLTIDNPILSVVGGGTEATAQRVTIATDSTGVLSVDDNGGNLSIDDGGNSITVDYATTGSGNATGALRVELANNGTGVLATLGTITNVVHVDDNTGSLTVDNNGTFAVQAVGTKSNNAVVPGATNLGTLPAIATVAVPAYTEGNQVALSTDLTGQLRISGSISASTSANVKDVDADAGYVNGDTGKSLTQTPDGRLRVAIAALVSDAVQSYTDGSIRSLSLSGDGRLRVITASESYNFTPWGGGETWGSDDSYINGSHPLCAW